MIVGIRHLPTPLNKEGILQGSIDSNELIVHDEDKKTINSNLLRLGDLSKYVVLCSELKRTQLTAHLYGLNEYKTSALLNELSFSEFEGKPKTEFLEIAGDNWLNDVYRTPLSKEIKALEYNIEQFLKLYGNKDCIVFGHGAFFRGLKSKLAHGSLKVMNQFEIENNELCFFDLI